MFTGILYIFFFLPLFLHISKKKSKNFDGGGGVLPPEPPPSNHKYAFVYSSHFTIRTDQFYFSLKPIKKIKNTTDENDPLSE